jgi:hypothetical protein
MKLSCFIEKLTVSGHSQDGCASSRDLLFNRAKLSFALAVCAFASSAFAQSDGGEKQVRDAVQSFFSNFLAIIYRG